jgi:hypothetical protein
MKLIYVSGPMTPTKAFPHMAENIDRLNRAGRTLFEQGYAVIVPCFMWFDEYKPYIDELKADKYGTLYHAIISMDLALVERCDAIYMLYGWETSRGAVAERTHALEHGKEVMYERLF